MFELNFFCFNFHDTTINKSMIPIWTKEVDVLDKDKELTELQKLCVLPAFITLILETSKKKNILRSVRYRHDFIVKRKVIKQVAQLIYVRGAPI